MRKWEDTKNNVLWFKLIDLIFYKPTKPSELICPECKKNTLHYFYLGWEEKRGGNWIWCSSCLSFMHTSGLVPDWWKNIRGVSDELLEP